MSWMFHVEKVDQPLPGVRRIVGVAKRKKKQVPFYLTLSAIVILLSVKPDKEGRKLIAYFTRILGPPTLKYRDKRGEYEDYTAEWHLLKDNETILQRIIQHLNLGFTPQEL